MSKVRIKQLMEEANTSLVQAQGILKEFEGKELPKDKSDQVDKLLDEVDSKKSEASRLKRVEEMNAEFNDPATRLPSPQGDPEEKGKGGDNQPTAEQKAFNRFLKHGIRGLTDTEQKALSASDDQAGGFAVAPQQFATTLLKFVDDRVFIRQLATVEQITQAESLGVLSLDADLSDWDWTTELATGQEDQIKPFGKRALSPHPVAKRIKISNTLIRKSTKPIETLVQQRLAYKLGVTQEKAYMSGDGNQKPLGLFVADANGIPAGRDVTYTDTNVNTRSDSLIDTKFFLKEQYQNSPNTRWVVSREFVKRVRKFRDGNGMFLWNPGLALTGGQPATILDIPYAMSEFAPATFTSGNYIAVLGDISFYWIVDALQMTVQVLNELYAETNQRGYIVRYEGDGGPQLAEAFARLKVA